MINQALIRLVKFPVFIFTCSLFNLWYISDVISKFIFRFAPKSQVDEDGDLIVERKPKYEIIEIGKMIICVYRMKFWILFL